MGNACAYTHTHAHAHTVNLLIVIKSLYSILLIPFLISRCIDDTFFNLLLCVSLLLLVLNNKISVAYLEARSRGSFVSPPTVMFSTLSKYLFCMSMNELRLTNSTTRSLYHFRRSISNQLLNAWRFCILAKFRSCENKQCDTNSLTNITNYAADNSYALLLLFIMQRAAIKWRKCEGCKTKLQPRMYIIM